MDTVKTYDGYVYIYMFICIWVRYKCVWVKFIYPRSFVVRFFQRVAHVCFYQNAYSISEWGKAFIEFSIY